MNNTSVGAPEEIASTIKEIEITSIPSFTSEEHPALAFLRVLDPLEGRTFNIETYTDLPKGAKKPRPDPLSRQYPCRSIDEIRELVPCLQQINMQGAGVFVAVNQCNGPRSKLNIDRIRGVHADLDGASEEVLTSIRDRLQPTIEVQSSGPQNWQFYWLLAPGEEMSPVTAEAINRGLVHLGADPAAVDVSRLLRLPGFRHMKNRTKEVTHGDA